MLDSNKHAFVKKLRSQVMVSFTYCDVHWCYCSELQIKTKDPIQITMFLQLKSLLDVWGYNGKATSLKEKSINVNIHNARRAFFGLVSTGNFHGKLNAGVPEGNWDWSGKYCETTKQPSHYPREARNFFMHDCRKRCRCTSASSYNTVHRLGS